MDKKLTPLQELVVEIEAGLKICDSEERRNVYDMIRRRIIKKYLPAEREEISSAYDTGYGHGSDLDRGRQWEFFKDTYKTP